MANNRLYTAGTNLDSGEFSRDGCSRLFDLNSSARYLGISYWSIRTLINNGSLPAVRIGRRLLIDRRDIDRFIEANKSQEEPY